MALPSSHLGKRAAVTGGAGFLGSHLCERLLARGLHVICLDNLITGSAANIEHLAASPSFTLIDRDITEGFSIDGEVDYVFHLASPASPADYLRLPVQTLRAGSIGTINALEVARQKQARFVLASSSEVYGDPRQHPQPESYWGNVNPIGPRSPYDEAKRFAEATAAAYAKTYNVSIAIARIFNSYGPRMRPGDGRAIPTFIRQALAGEPLTVTGNGRQTRSICYADDTIDGILALAASPHPGPVNIGSDHEMTMLQIATMIRDISRSASPIQFIPRPADDPSVRRPDTRQARTLLGWAAKIPPPQGLKRTIAWFAARPEPAHPDGLPAAAQYRTELPGSPVVINRAKT
jgi:dTDP-glucose 4,6-dehydratase